MKISIMMLTWDRYEITKKCWEQTFLNMIEGFHHVDLELLICDQGSTDKRIIEYFQTKDFCTLHRLNSKNEGVAHSFNQLFLWSSGDIIVMLGNDILMPPRWLKTALDYLDKVPNAGLVGWDWGHGQMPSIEEKFGVRAHFLTPQLNRVFGSWVFKRKIIEEIGFFHEGYGPYGIEDSDFNERVNIAGFNSFYIPNTLMKSEHLGHADEHDSGEYRKAKDESLSKNLTIFTERIKTFHTKGIKEPLPEMRPPL